jgi:hypothetical protein
MDLDSTPRLLDGAGFVCRVAVEALGLPPAMLQSRPSWLLDNLVEVDVPGPGDVVGYRDRDDEHVMLYLGNGLVIGACNVAGSVTIRSIEYERDEHGNRWTLVDPPAFRVLDLAPWCRGARK